MQEFNEHYAQVSKNLEAEKKRSALIEESKAAAATDGGGFWWDEVIDNFGVDELEQYAAALEELKKNVAMRADELMLVKASSLPPTVFANPGGLVADHFITTQANDCETSIVPHGYDFAHGQF
ncbi:hypothetical protein U1Q18_030769 [Sarracenia purpurea var. burkii]